MKVLKLVADAVLFIHVSLVMDAFVGVKLGSESPRTLKVPG